LFSTTATFNKTLNNQVNPFEIIEISEKLALHCSKYFFDHSKVCFTANPKLALQAQTLQLRFCSVAVLQSCG